MLVTAETFLPPNILLPEGTSTGANFPFTFVDKFDFDSETVLIDDERIVLVNVCHFYHRMKPMRGRVLTYRRTTRTKNGIGRATRRYWKFWSSRDKLPICCPVEMLYAYRSMSRSGTSYDLSHPDIFYANLFPRRTELHESLLI